MEKICDNDIQPVSLINGERIIFGSILVTLRDSKIDYNSKFTADGCGQGKGRDGGEWGLLFNHLEWMDECLYY